MKRFFPVLCALVMIAGCAFAELEVILPEGWNGAAAVYEAAPRDFAAAVRPEMFNESGIAQEDERGSRHVIFADEAQLWLDAATLFYDEYRGTVTYTYELEKGRMHTDVLPRPTNAGMAAVLAGWMTAGWPETGEVYALENDALAGITLQEARQRAEALLAALGLEGYTCETTLDMSLERIREMGARWNELIDRGVILNSPRLDDSKVNQADEGYFLRYRRFGSEGGLGDMFYADLYVTAEGMPAIYLRDPYAMGKVMYTPDRLISWEDAAAALKTVLAESSMQPVAEEIVTARLTWYPVQTSETGSGMVFVPVWALNFIARHDGLCSAFYGIIRADDGELLDKNWY